MSEIVAVGAIAIIGTVFFLTVGIAIILPFLGALVRMRAEYLPKPIRLEGSDGGTVSRPATLTLFGMIGRVVQLEGASGLWKGFLPLLGSTIVVTLASMAVVAPMIDWSSGQPRADINKLGPSLTVGISLSTLLWIPLNVIVVRSIVTPLRIPYSAPRALNLLLSPAEWANPLRLYLISGLALATLLQAICVGLLTWLLRVLLIGYKVDGYTPTLNIVVFLLYRLVSTAWQTPLDVIATRLAMQPVQGRDDVEGEAAQVVSEQGVEFVGKGEDVIKFRPAGETYSGFVGCVDRMVLEEGIRSLYRGWVWTFIGNLFGGA